MFLYAKNIGVIGSPVHACRYLNSQRSALSQADRTVTVGRHRIAIACAADGDGGDGCVYVCALVTALACARERVCMCAHKALMNLLKKTP